MLKWQQKPSNVKRKINGDEKTVEESDSRQVSASPVSCVVLEMGQPVGPLDRYIEVRRSRAEAEEDFEHVVQSGY